METPLLPRLYIARTAAPLLRNCGDEIGSLRGAQETGRHAVELLPRAAGAFADGTRARAGDVVEDTPESAETFPAGLEGDVRDGQVRLAQQGHGAFDASREQVAMRRNAKGQLERARKVGL